MKFWKSKKEKIKYEVIIRYDCVNGKSYDYGYTIEKWKDCLEKLKNNNWNVLTLISDNDGLNFAHVVYFERIK